MIRIICISDFWTPKQAKNVFTNVFLKGRNNYTEHIQFVDDNTFTHVILLNKVMPRLGNIPKENVLGIGNEPVEFLKIDNNFVNYVKQYCGKYIVGRILPHFSSEFELYYPFLCHPWVREDYFRGNTPKKKHFMSISFSGKQILEGHRYRKSLIDKILATELDIHIWGHGTKALGNDKRLKGSYEETHGFVISDYKFVIYIENSQSEEYISDKLPACIALNTIPIYWGAKNVEKYFGPKCYWRLVGDLDKDMQLLKNIFNEPEKYTLDLSNARRELFEGKAYFMKFLYDHWVK